ncbi:fungal-specific transcription factor domain-containing protein [Aspergillus granulosus]|uniref:Fungal-specific transcription factor domain-containing protein n=1 Tax=Aspergillus granulosus TaxID=176169 RepID=A0ABR4GX97_9EURO
MQKALAEKPCHNCRRRRLKCDRAVPRCAKCAHTGQECLGYGKLFLWNRGVASRGKMMGKDFPSPGHDVAITMRRGDVWNSTRSYLQGPLLDPIFGDLDYTSRRYLFHFANTLSSDMVISSAHNANPFCSLIPLAREHPILLHAIVANAALHISCLHQRANGTLDLDSFQSLDSHSDPSNLSTCAKIDALSSKHNALVLLRHSLTSIHSNNIDIDLIITVIHLFITFDLIDMGESGWRAHVQGAIQLISRLKALEQTRRPSPLAGIRDSIMSDCLTYYILGSTLLRTPTLDDPFLFSGADGTEITASLIRAEANSYLSLPTPLLQILFKACELSNLVSVRISTTLGAPHQPDRYASIPMTLNILLEQVRSLNIIPWAESLECSSPARQQSRIHIALAHRAAVQIYIIRSVDGLPLDPSPYIGNTTEVLVSSIVTHLSHIGISDPMFKATCWPTFIAGAETDNPAYRQWAVGRLREFWSLIPWGYIRTAVEVMRTSWEVGDLNGDGDGDGGMKRGRSWIQGLKALERGWLIP